MFRIRRENQDAVAKLFPDATFGPAPTSYMGGCSDPECCMQHPGTGMIGVRVFGVSGNQFHKALVAAGIVKQ
jgi:hypothetical protein